METYGGVVLAAVVVFAGTNIDDLVVLTLLFLAGRASGRPRPWQVWLGQYAGIGALVAVSALAAAGLAVVPDRWVGLLGLVPFGLGGYGLLRAVRSTHEQPPPPVVAGSVLAVAGVTVANGADNISVYTPVLRSLGWTGGTVTVAVFAALVAVWCAAGSWLGSHRAAVAVVRRHGHLVVPVVFMIIGAAIVLGSGVLR